MPGHKRWRHFSFLVLLLAVTAGCGNRPGPVITLPVIAPTTTQLPVATPHRPMPTVTPTSMATATAIILPDAATPTPAVSQLSARPASTRRPPSTPTTIPLSRGTGAMPPIPDDLLFIENRHLWRWNHASAQIELVASGPILAYEVADAVGRVVYVREEAGGHALYWQDLGHGFQLPAAAETMVARENVMRSIAMAPDGSRLAYVREDTPYSGTIFAGEIDAGTVEPVAPCPEVRHPDGIIRCGSLFWGAAPERLLFRDGAGLWELDLIDRQATMWLAFKAEGVTAWVTYEPLRWSPSREFLLLRQNGYEGSGEVVFDPQRGSVATIPGSGTYGDFPRTILSWLPGDRLLVLSSQYYEEFPAEQPGRIWQARHQGEVLTAGREFDPPFDGGIFLPPILDPNRPEIVLLGINDVDGFDPVRPRLVALDWNAGAVQTLGGYEDVPDLDPDKITGIWSPDGSIALVRFQEQGSGAWQSSFYLIGAGGGPAIPIPVIETGHHFRWIGAAGYVLE